MRLDVVRHQLGAIAADLPIEKVRTIAEVLDLAIAQERLMSAISLFLAAMVIAIGCVGLYALMSYDVEQRTRELGIRLALGATTSERRHPGASRQCGAGPARPRDRRASRDRGEPSAGVAALRRPGRDPWTLVSVALVLTAVALIATLRPAQRPSQIDPIALLRSE